MNEAEALARWPAAVREPGTVLRNLLTTPEEIAASPTSAFLRDARD